MFWYIRINSGYTYTIPVIYPRNGIGFFNYAAALSKPVAVFHRLDRVLICTQDIGLARSNGRSGSTDKLVFRTVVFVLSKNVVLNFGPVYPNVLQTEIANYYLNCRKCIIYSKARLKKKKKRVKTKKKMFNLSLDAYN